ncbi:hypothetical protein EFK50_21490 [Nocardioides marmoriginsengisoli]|uniref:Uncharacterized protein n=1 Tax=Nocardioides marmoriginsengisoli TaxID=661483 RepID=A0A3N0C908_9ACTN|nr:hypothetical protein [Nocardioides marmoriginsengisoli]RNL59964.1 hypothetical protein EFK50_21490 [Nocardioides marmoriginsengisoli]
MRRLILVLTACLALGTGWALTGTSTAAEDDVPTAAVPVADCGPGSRPETGIQGRVPRADYDSGRALQGYTCNTEQTAHQGKNGGFKTLRYTDSQGQTCAFYDSSALTSPDALLANTFNGAGNGVVVLDMTDPAHPVKTANLISLAMLNPHESLLVNQERGLLVGVLGTAATAPGVLDVYDVKTNCRKPKLLSSTLTGILGHETGFAPDGKTLYVSSTVFTLVAIDLTNPKLPKTIFVQPNVQYHGMRLSADGRTLYAAHIGVPSTGLITGGGLRILDVSQIQDRVRNPKAPVLATMTWRGSSIPQVAEPFTRDGHQYLLEIDEFVDIFSFKGLLDLKNSPVGAARIINVDDPQHPYLVSNIRLKVHEPAVHSGEASKDPGTASPLGGYAGHYCSMPTRDNPDIAGCSMILSGLRLFDIRDVEHPKEVGYFNMPTKSGGSAFSQPAWDPANDAVWYTDTGSGFYNVRLKNGIENLLPQE